VDSASTRSAYLDCLWWHGTTPARGQKALSFDVAQLSRVRSRRSTTAQSIGIAGRQRVAAIPSHSLAANE